MRFLLMILFWLIIIVLSLFLYFVSFLPKALTDSFYHRMARIWCRIFVRALGVNHKLVHKNTNPLPKHFILIGNHPSSFEDFGVPSLFDVHALAKEGVRHWLFLGRMAESAGTIFFKRDDPESRHAVKDVLVDALMEGKNIVLFPEGGCFSKRIHESFKTGAFDISIKTGVPIIPILLHYEDQEGFEWLDPDTLLDNLWQIMTAKNNLATYYVFDAVYPENFKDKEEFTTYMHSQYLDWQKTYLD